MKKDKNHIDKLFNESLNQRSFDIPEAFLEDLNKRLDMSERKRRVFFWWFTGLLCLTGLSLIIFFSLQSPSFSLSHSTQFTPSANNKSYVSINSKTRVGRTQWSIANNEIAVFDTMTAKPDHISNSSIKTKIQSAEKHNQNRSKVQKHIQPKISKNKMGNTIAPADNAGIQVPSNLTDPNKTTDKSTSEKTTAKPKEDIKDSGTSKADSTLVSETKKDSTAVNPTDTTSANPLVPAENPDDEKKGASDDSWRKEIQLFGGLGANFIHDSHASKAYLDKVRENQSSILAPTFGIQGNLSYKKFTFGTGLSYSKTGEKYTSEVMKYTYKDSTYSEHVIDTILVFDDSLGIWVPEILDTTYYHTYQYKQDSVQERMSFKNRYSWISIPIYFGYRFELGKYELIPRIGAQFNFGIAKNRGSYPNENFNGVAEYRAVRFNISYLIQLEARRNFDRWYVFINPYFNSMINPAISGDVIRRKYSSWGVLFGVGLKL
ncbi:hypothetical protein D3C87_33860 [compost metagenome]